MLYSIVILLIITPRKFLDSNMDSGEIVYAVVEEVIGKTGKFSLKILTPQRSPILHGAD